MVSKLAVGELVLANLDWMKDHGIKIRAFFIKGTIRLRIFLSSQPRLLGGGGF